MVPRKEVSGDKAPDKQDAPDAVSSILNESCERSVEGSRIACWSFLS